MMKPLCTISVALISLGLNAQEPVSAVLKHYETEVGKWEKDIAQFEALDRKTDYAKDAIIFTGSSSIRLWSTIAEDLAPYSVIQRGFGGSKYSDLAWYIDRIASPHGFQAVGIFVANDVSGKASDKTPEQVKPLLDHIVARIHAVNADAPIFFIAITPTESRWKVWEKTSALNDTIAALCETSDKLHFIATAEHYLNDEGKPRAELFRDDRLHLNRDGYTLWGSIIKKELDRVLVSGK